MSNPTASLSPPMEVVRRIGPLKGLALAALTQSDESQGLYAREIEGLQRQIQRLTAEAQKVYQAATGAASRTLEAIRLDLEPEGKVAQGEALERVTEGGQVFLVVKAAAKPKAPSATPPSA